MYVVSGGNEDAAGSERLRDRLYLNAGDGVFSPAPVGALPDLRESGSAAVAADFDRDGDLDLFVGGRAKPGEYPEPARSALLRNEGGRFVDVTDELAVALSHVGMVTSAVWSDVDDDGWVDLLVTCEWGPVSLWRNANGTLREATKEAGLASRTGWWNGIAPGDIDNDGDMDYVVTNFGLNTKYHASDDRPVVLFYGDMDDNGRKDVIEAKYVDHGLLPVRGKSCSTNAIPVLGEKCRTFHEFASLKLDELYGADKLESSTRLEATTLESGILVNDGSGAFEFRALPRIAQVAPGFGPTIADLDADGRADIYFVQNFYSPQRETVRMDGGVSQLLLGDGAGGFAAAPPRESGLVVPGDAKGLGVADLNSDGRPDLLVTNNEGPLEAFENDAGEEHRAFTVRLVGRPGNPTGVGARVTLVMADGSTQTAETHCGGGYLSQSSATLFFGLGAERTPMSVRVRWPDGAVSESAVAPAANKLTIEQPAA